MRILLTVVLVLTVLVVVASYVASPIDPMAWEPAPDPGLRGEFAPNTELASASRLLEGAGSGPEAVACGPGGELYTGFNDGRILVFDPAGNFRELVNTGGRPLGMKVDGAGHLIVADAVRGLLSVGPDGGIEVLTDSVDGKRMVFVDDLDIAEDGTIWFSDASTRRDYRESIYDFLEGQRTGRLLSYEPDSGNTKVHLDGLFFANGVALGPGDNYVLVNETGAGRIHRLWLEGERAGRSDLFHEGLPGAPDNITFDGRNTFWVGMPSLRGGIDQMADKPWLRRLLSLLPPNVLSANANNYSFVVGLGLDGEVKANLQDSELGYINITSAVDCEGVLYLGSLTMPAVAALPL